MILILTIDNANIGDTNYDTNYLDITTLLSDHNYSVMSIADIDDALQIAKNINLEMILCCSFTQSVISTMSIIPKFGEVVRKLRTNLHTQHYPIVACFSAQVPANSIHWLVKQGIDCCYLLKTQIDKSDNERELVSTIRYVIRQTKDNYGFLKYLLSDFN